MTGLPGLPAEPLIGSLCTGYGGLDLATFTVFGGHLAWCADSDTRVAEIIAARFPGVPNLGDITTLDWRHVTGVHILTAGFPCQDISTAGRRAGIQEGTRSGIWTDIVAAVRLLRPLLLIVENVAALRWRGLDRVLADLASTGYDTTWRCVRASDVGAPHRRERLFLLAWPAPTAAAHPAGARPLRSRGPGNQTPHRTRHQPQRRRLPSAGARDERRRAACPDERLVSSPGHVAEQCAATTSWGPYAAAIRRWERVLDRPAPPPTEPGRDGNERLAPRFAEWMMGLPAGWVTGIDISRTAQLRAIGNGVIPQQGIHALRLLAADLPVPLPRQPVSFPRHPASPPPDVGAARGSEISRPIRHARAGAGRRWR